MKLISVLAGAAALVVAAGALAAEPADDAAPKEKKICKSEKMTGSLTRVRRTCLTQREWNQLAEQTRRNMSELDRQSNQRSALPGSANGSTSALTPGG